MRLLFVASLVWLVGCSVSAQEPMADLEGVYVSDTKDADGKQIAGAVTIFKMGDVYFVQTITAQAGSTKGIGIRQGDTLAVGWVYEGKAQGVTLYRIKTRTLEGRWAQLGKGTMQSETLTWVKGLPKDE